MDSKPISETLSVSGQIAADDLAAIRDAGFRAIVCNRPDGEAADQPPFADIAAAARAAGLEARYLPVVSGQLTDEDAAAFRRLMDELPKPVLAYCRSGTRSGQLWARAQEVAAAAKPGDQTAG
jgi:sulfide:quinone oxidoreductase